MCVGFFFFKYIYIMSGTFLLSHFEPASIHPKVDARLYIEELQLAGLYDIKLALVQGHRRAGGRCCHR